MEKEWKRIKKQRQMEIDPLKEKKMLRSVQWSQGLLILSPLNICAGGRKSTAPNLYFKLISTFYQFLCFE